MQVEEIIKKVKDLMGGSSRVAIDINDQKIADIVKLLHGARLRLAMAQEDLAVDFPTGGSTTLTIYRIGAAKPEAKSEEDSLLKEKEQAERATKVPKPRPVIKRHQHSYVPPKVAKDIIAIMADEGSHVIQLVGPTGCGKTTLVHYLGREMGRRVFQINCRGDMGSESFFGEKTIVVDPATKQNIISYQKGVLEQAMTEGLDEQGNEVGPAAILFVDELPSCPANIAQALNRFFESDDPRRTLVLDQDGGRVIRSHSGLRILVAGNTTGRGIQGVEEAGYTAQAEALDISLLNRVAGCFRMGYDKKVEQHILAEKIGDDRIAAIVIKFRDAIRSHVKAGKLTTPFSTRHIVNIANLYRIWGDLGKAVFFSTFETLSQEEKAVYNETWHTLTTKDLLKDFEQDDVDYV